MNGTSIRSSTTNNFRPTFTIHDLRLRLSIAYRVTTLYTTLVSRLRNGTSNVPRKTILYETRFYETYEYLRVMLWPTRTRLHLVRAQDPAGFFYGSHSATIGGFNSLSQLQSSREWIMQRLDWTDDAMFRVYYDSRVTACEDSK